MTIIKIYDYCFCDAKVKKRKKIPFLCIPINRFLKWFIQIIRNAMNIVQMASPSEPVKDILFL